MRTSDLPELRVILRPLEVKTTKLGADRFPHPNSRVHGPVSYLLDLSAYKRRVQSSTSAIVILTGTTRYV